MRGVHFRAHLLTLSTAANDKACTVGFLCANVCNLLFCAVHTQLLLSIGGRIDETLAARYVALADRCCQHEAFDATHRDLLSSWRTQISDKVPLQRCKAVLLQPLALKSAAKQLKGQVLPVSSSMHA